MTILSQCSGPRRALIVTGEASGDLHGANLIKAAQQLDPDLSFCGVGGEKMAAAGCEILIPSSELSVMGLVEVVRHLPRIWRVFQQLKQLLFSPQPPDVVILIDSPDFNLRLAKQAKKAGIPVVYYVSPQVWAWRKGRVKGISAVVDRLAAIFPFEPDCYRGYPIDVRYVGHPLLDEAGISDDVEAIRQRYQLTGQGPTIGLFPGSRQNELTYSFPTIVATAAQLARSYPDADFIVPLAPGVDEEQLRPQLETAGVNATFVRDSIYDTAAVCDVVLCVSGTVTLQVALVETPMAILYKAAPVTYAIGKHLVSVEFIGLPNIVAGKSVVREFIQDDANPQALSDEIKRILDDEAYHQTMKQHLAEVRHRMGEPGCSGRVAEMAIELSCEHAQQGSSHGRA
ncbi:lipid-A-disaccharide synthase [uncultured Desulfuromonas sp.]|uniref:lipid-A-disaccharide synthase n=1 Tax=uncultured Desulfuromonas sp. TaxID=181013 RepID=UPI002AAC009E|nr:lipid-A-disaccharide synthase [uncultured Desulfuromonas sp.]